ncbi:MAG: hypothetical protein JXA03_05775 [Bacteroidales bacterium]|nr:hypothetical protein [Bacteroidales bacterium]
MKVNVAIRNVLIPALCVSLMVISGCKSKEKALSTSKQGETLIDVYCQGSEYNSDKEYTRANQVGESIDQATAKKKAMSNARADLASAVQTRIKGVIDNYVNSRELNNDEDTRERFESLTREVIDQKLNDVRTICEKTTKTSAGNYKTYIALEMAMDGLMDAMNSKLSNDDILKIDYDYEQFKKTFEEEMNKMEKERENN